MAPDRAEPAQAPGSGSEPPGRRGLLARGRSLLATGWARAHAAGEWLWRVARPAREWLRPRLAVVRPAGWATLGAACVSYVVGRLLGWQEFLVVALLLAVLLVVAAVFVVGRSTYAVRLDMARLRVRVGADAFGALTVTNASGRPLRGSVFRLPVGQATSLFGVPRLAGHATREETFQVDTRRRAVVPLGPVTSSRGDGLGLLSRDIRWTEVLEMFIHPRTVSLSDSSTGFLKDLEGIPTDTLSSSDIAFHALRDYVVGDDLRHVHWKSSARTGRLLVRQFEETRRSHLVVCLAQAADDYATGDDFELAVSVAASLGEQAIREEKDLTVQVPAGPLRVETGQRLLDDCARLEFARPVIPVEAVALAAAAAAPDASVAVIVAGAPVSPRRLHSATARFGADVVTIVLRCEVGAQLALGAIGGTRVLTVGALDDLPRALRVLEA